MQKGKGVKWPLLRKLHRIARKRKNYRESPLFKSRESKHDTVADPMQQQAFS